MLTLFTSNRARHEVPYEPDSHRLIYKLTTHCCKWHWNRLNESMNPCHPY